MLRITIQGEEFFNDETQEFSTVNDFVLELEHSLFSLSKWESKFQKPFLSRDTKTQEEIFAYVEAMILSPVYPPEIWSRFDQSNLNEINEYIDSKQSATTFSSTPDRKGRGDVVTSELIYYWMVSFNIPFECQFWHLNRLFALIRICNLKNGKQKKMTRGEIAARNRELNAQRRAQLGTRG